MKASREVIVRPSDYSVMGLWVQMVYPDALQEDGEGKITLPKGDICKVPQKYQEDVLRIAQRVCESQRRLLYKAWSYEYLGTVLRKSVVQFLIKVDRRTKPRGTLKSKVVQGEFLLEVGWFHHSEDGLIVFEHDRAERNVNPENTFRYLGEEHIPASLVDKILGVTEAYVHRWIETEEEATA